MRKCRTSTQVHILFRSSVYSLNHLRRIATWWLLFVERSKLNDEKIPAALSKVTEATQSTSYFRRQRLNQALSAEALAALTQTSATFSSIGRFRQYTLWCWDFQWEFIITLKQKWPHSLYLDRDNVKHYDNFKFSSILCNPLLLFLYLRYHFRQWTLCLWPLK